MRFLKGKSCDLQHYFYTKCITLFFFKSRILKVEIKRSFLYNSNIGNSKKEG